MPDSALGRLLRKLRELRGLTLRNVADLSKVDHAYVYRLETGEKTTPSDDVIGRLERALRPPRREAEILHYLASHAETDPDLITFVGDHSDVSFEDFGSLASVAHRGTGRPDYPTLLRRLRKLLAEEGDDG